MIGMLTKRIGALLCLGLSACTGTETGNPSFVGKLGYDAYTSEPSVVALSLMREEEGAARVTVDNAWLVLGDVELQRGTDCAAGLHVHGLGAGDHAGGQAEPTEFESAAGEYCGVRLPFAPAAVDALPDGAPASLEKESILVRGTLADGVTFEIHSQLQESLSLRATAGEFVLDSAHANVVIGFDVARWLRDLTWDDASESDGMIVVSASDNAVLLEQFEAALPEGIALFRDHDGDGKLDDKAMQIATAARE
jgi:hypothetical protein